MAEAKFGNINFNWLPVFKVNDCLSFIPSDRSKVFADESVKRDNDDGDDDDGTQSASR